MNPFKLEQTYHTLPAVFYRQVLPSATKNPRLLVLNETVARELNFTKEQLMSKEGIAFLSGQDSFENEPIAQAYMGHQFGHLTMLGDGRAILLGERKVNEQVYDIQLKGAGPTPYSRGGDGLASLGPMLREYIMSETLAFLNIPTTRTLAVVETGGVVQRMTPERGALISRIAQSHLRVGTFQYGMYYASMEERKQLADYVIERHYPYLVQTEQPYVSFFKEVMKKQAQLIAKWQAVGFVHGVMNTDNMTISGETIDYGPCAFLDTYVPHQVFSSIDQDGRYAYNQQPKIAGWNLTRLAESLLPLFAEEQERAVRIAEEILPLFGQWYEHYWLTEMRKKLGLVEPMEEDALFVSELLTIMAQEQRDFTETFIDLTIEDEDALQLATSDLMKDWYRRWQSRIKSYRVEAIEQMKKVNPSFIPRNYLVDRAIADWVLLDDSSSVEQLIEQVRQPFSYSKWQLDYRLPELERNKRHQTFCGT